MKTEILRIKNISKKIQQEPVLNNINITIYEGDIHVLIGRNGTGKTTIVQLLSGNLKADRGEIYFREKRVNIGAMKEAKALGIGYVGQETRYVSSMNIAENIFLLNRSKNVFFWKKKSEHIKARYYMNMVGLQDTDVSAMGWELNTAQKKCVELARELSSGVTFIILDEFMATMTQEEAKQTIQVIHRLNSIGITFFMITNKLNEAFDMADRITVMRQGNICYTLRKGEYTKEILIRHLLGDPEFPINRKKDFTGKALLNVKNLAAGTKVKNVSLNLYEGEITVLVGHGKKELLQSLYGLKKIYGGFVWMNGKPIKIKSPQDAMKYKIGYMPQNRKQQGLIDNIKVKENLSIGVLNKVSVLGLINRRVEKYFTGKQAKKLYIEEFLDRKTQNISRGNKQKVLLAKCLMAQPKILILINPTEGADIQSSREIQKVLLESTGQGMAILMCTDDIETIYHCADRVLHFKDGEIVKSFITAEQSIEYLSSMMAE